MASEHQPVSQILPVSFCQSTKKEEKGIRPNELVMQRRQEEALKGVIIGRLKKRIA